MEASAFITELEAYKAALLAPIVGAGRLAIVDESGRDRGPDDTERGHESAHARYRSVGPGAVPGTDLHGATPSRPAVGDSVRLLQVALANEINVSELAALWMPTTAELDVKLAFARQAGDEASHFQLVADRLTALGLDVAGFRPADNPMFVYLRGLTTTVERIAAGLFTLESIAYAVNQNFMAFCAAKGDHETVRIYEAYIQPDELAHQQLGQRLLARYAVTDEQQAVARATVGRLLELASATRASAAARLGTACVPGC